MAAIKAETLTVKFAIQLLIYSHKVLAAYASGKNKKDQRSKLFCHDYVETFLFSNNNSFWTFILGSHMTKCLHSMIIKH